MEDQHMKKALASIVIIAFAGLLCTSLLAIFSGSKLAQQYVTKHQQLQYPYFMAY
jgi:hypothetical protein